MHSNCSSLSAEAANGRLSLLHESAMHVYNRENEAVNITEKHCETERDRGANLCEHFLYASSERLCS